MIYGVGNMLGAGIYGLVGKAAGELGNMVWLGFFASMIAAGLTGLSYASLGSRYPRAAGAAYITHRAFGITAISYVVGLAVTMSGLTSLAAASQVFANYAHEMFTDVPIKWVVVVFILTLTVVNYVGMRESAWVNAICTAIEAGGLLLVVAVGARYWGSVDYFDASSLKNPGGDFSVSLMLSGAVLTFYAFIGFEDLLNISEEVRNPRRNFPIALLAALGIAATLYMAVCITAVSVVPHAQLAAASGPLVEVVRIAAPWVPPALFTVVAMFAVTNTALLNYIMGSRLVYGMARQGLLPALLGRLHPRRNTPHVAILLLLMIVLGLALVGDIKALASATSLLLLGSFTLVNLALVVLKRRPGEPRGGFEVPLAVPLGGALVAVTFIVNRVVAGARAGELAPVYIAGGIVVAIVVMYLLLRPQAAAVVEVGYPKQVGETE
ncbi:MAG: APC family permease [Gammaproteobacteria bacterium]|nr:APC family permease [Gammaproteobacteria bacterium]